MGVTGYVGMMLEKNMSFKEFALTCARAFGACVMMRDDPLDKEIPDKFEESDYYLKSLEEAKQKLQTLESMSESKKLEFGSNKRKSAIASYKKLLKEDEAQNNKCLSMLEQVSNYNPPFPDLINLKEFMEEQLTISMNDTKYWEEEISKAESKSPLDWYNQELESARHDIVYYTKHLKEEREMVNNRNLWIKQLRESLNEN